MTPTPHVIKTVFVTVAVLAILLITAAVISEYMHVKSIPAPTPTISYLPTLQSTPPASLQPSIPGLPS